MVALVKKYGPERILVNSAADWGISDPLKVPKTASLMLESGVAEEAIEKVCWKNPVAFFAQSGRLDISEVEERPRIDNRELWEGNSVLRGQAPIVEER